MYVNIIDPLVSPDHIKSDDTTCKISFRGIGENKDHTVNIYYYLASGDELWFNDNGTPVKILGPKTYIFPTTGKNFEELVKMKLKPCPKEKAAIIKIEARLAGTSLPVCVKNIGLKYG